MFAHRLLVIGGVAAGLSAASRARRRDPRLEITVLEKGPHISYSACGLPYFIGGHVRDAAELVVYTAEYFREKRGIEVLTGCEAVEIQLGRRRVRAVDRETHEEKIFHFDRLVLATGARTDWPSLPGLDQPHVFQANTLEGALAVRQYVERALPRRAAVLGGGYIGLETAEALCERGLEVTVLQRGEEILEGFDADVTRRVEEALTRHGVLLLKEAPALAVKEGEVVSAAGRHPADLVIVSTGFLPNVELAQRAGVALGPTGAISVDERMQTNLAGIYAAGDCTETVHLVSGRKVWIPLGTTANKQGRVAGENAAGGHARFSGVVGTAVTKIFGLECGRTGLSEAQARDFRTVAVTVEHPSRAHYMGGREILVKLVAERGSGRLLGAQMVGPEGVAKRIDVLATALHARMTVEQVAELDLSYNPPVAPVWDPILIAAQQALKKI